MTACTRTRTRLLVLGAIALACTRDDRNVLVAPPSFSLDPSHMISGSLLGPDGMNICNTIGSGTMPVRLLNPAFPAGPAFLGAQDLPCPTNSYSFFADAGTARVRVQLPTDAIVGLALPWRTLDSVAVGDADVTHDVHIVDGTALGGSATLDGSPVPDVGLDLVYGFNPGFGVASGSSAPDGHWAEFFGRSHVMVQNGVSVQAAVGCAALGVKVLEGPPAGPFVFPTERSAINCSLLTAPATQFSHTLTRLVVTPMPGDIGGQSVELADQYGIGWGVQFPVGPGQSPVHFPASATHLFGGGLLIGIAPDRILSGISVAGQLACGAACRDLGLDGVVGFTDETPAGKKVMWHYSDATSPEGVGLRVVQRSFDGQPPSDYVLFDFSIQNGGKSAVTFYAGVFMDWDVDEDAFDDFGFTDLGGRLMGVTSAFESGVHVGSLLVGAPVSGNLFYNFSGDVAVPSSTADQFQALSGGMRLTDIGPGDAHYIHGLGPITLARGKKADVWLGIIAGDNRDQFLANARAAEADIARRQQGGAEGFETLQSVNTGRVGIGVRPFTKSQKPQ